MLLIAVLFLGLARCHGDIRVTRANLYMDSVFLNKMPHAVGAAGLEPTDFSPMSIAVTPPNFGSRHSLMPGSTWNFKSLIVRGLSTGVGRTQDCPPTAIRNGNITVTCKVSFKNVTISLDGTMKWADSNGNDMPARTTARLTEGSAIVVASGPKRYRPGSLVRFDVTSLNFSLVPNYEPLAKELSKELRTRVKALFDTKYRAVLENAVSEVDLPAV